MLAHHATDGENAVAALLARARRLAHLGDRARSRVDGLGDLTVTDHGAVAEDHNGSPE
jgi:hypothetical protein